MAPQTQTCRTSLYRIIWENGEGSVQAFALESTRDAARRFFEAAIALIAGRPSVDLELYNLVSYRDLVDKGVSEDEDLRMFEIGSCGDVVTGWADKPIFLTTDPTLVGKWTELQAELAAQAAQTAIRR